MRPVAGIAGAFVALGIAALASRQLLGVPDLHTSLGLAATIRAGGFPVSLPWHVDTPASYHYGASLLAGLLAPPVGPDLVFVWELLGVYTWVSFALVVVAALRRRSSWLTALLLAPLLLSYGLHTSVSRTEALLRIPIPTGLPAAGLGNSIRLHVLGARSNRSEVAWDRYRMSGTPRSRWATPWHSSSWRTRHGQNVRHGAVA